MKSNNTAGSLSRVSQTMIDLLDKEQEGVEALTLKAILQRIVLELYVYVFIEEAAVPNIDWSTTIPKMDKLLKEIANTNLVVKLEELHEQEKCSPEHLREIIQLSNDFLLYISRLTKGQLSFP